MANKKKDFTGGIEGMLQRMNAEQQEQPTPAKETKQTASAPKAGRGRPKRPEWEAVTRATFIIDTTLLNELKQISYAETGRQGKKVTITAVLEDALRQYITKYKK